MPFFLIYLLKCSVGLAAVWLFYQLVLQRLTFYNWNRWYLVLCSMACFFIPFIDISPVLENTALSDTGLVQWVPVIDHSSAAAPALSSGTATGGWDIAIKGLITGMVFMLLRLLLQLISYYRMTRRAVLLTGDKIKVYQVNDRIAPFSFGRSVFINRGLHTDAELQEIIRHEFVHIRQRHSLDILWGEILCLINWFNPFAWQLKKSIRQNLEFIADNKVLEHGIPKREYQYLLLKVTGNHPYSIATSFSFSSLKKRIAMMNKLKSAKMSLLRFLFLLPLLAVILVSFRKQIGDRLSGITDQTGTNVTDTVPGSGINKKGYSLKITGELGNYEVEVRDAKGKEVKRIPLTEWEMNAEHYQNLYGKPEFDPPPAPPVPGTPAMPPAPPAPKKLPDGVEGINLNNKKLTITLRDGTTENYDLSVPAEKKAVEKKYGDILPRTPAPPAVPIAPGSAATTFYSPDAAEWEMSDKRVSIRFRDGRKEVFDLTDPKQKKDFTEKYGSPAVATTVAPSAPVVSRGGLTATAPTPAIARYSGGVTVTAPMAADEDVVIADADDIGHTITGKEDILLTITRNTTRQQLDLFVRQMKEKGVELDYDEIEYDDNGSLVKISGTMRSNSGRSNFVGVDFQTLTLAMIKKGDKTYFKVSTRDNKKVI